MDNTIVKTSNLDLFYGDFQALYGVNLEISKNNITALIGPSGCGKSTFLRCLNRMNDQYEGIKITGKIEIDNEDILTKNTDLIKLRKKVGMVFQRPNPFPLSVYENVAYGLRVHHLSENKSEREQIIEESLKAVLLWDDLKDKLKQNATTLTLEQQQKLCIARLLAVKPEVLLMDEPCSALDPIATLKIEELAHVLKKNYTIIIVTHNMQQAARASDYTGFFLLGKLIEFNKTGKLFTTPQKKETEDYITGRFG